MEKASIEEMAIGTYMNFNYFHTPISEHVDFLGIERRLQTNLHDFTQSPLGSSWRWILTCRISRWAHPASIRESLLEKVIKMGDSFVAAVRREYPPGIIGPFFPAERNHKRSGDGSV